MERVYNASRGAGRAIAVCANTSRKVRTPQGGIAANSRPARWYASKPRNRATETSLSRGRGCAPVRQLPCCAPRTWRRRDRVKRGNLYPEQLQIGMHAPLGARRATRSVHAGRRPEPASNGEPRRMIARHGLPRRTESGLQACSTFFSASGLLRHRPYNSSDACASPCSSKHHLTIKPASTGSARLNTQRADPSRPALPWITGTTARTPSSSVSPIRVPS